MRLKDSHISTRKECALPHQTEEIFANSNSNFHLGFNFFFQIFLSNNFSKEVRGGVLQPRAGSWEYQKIIDN